MSSFDVYEEKTLDKIKKISFIDLLICFPRKLKYDRVDIYSAQASFF